MDTTARTSACPAPTPRRGDRTRLCAFLCAVGFLPAMMLAALVTLSGERAARCLMYGEQCRSGLPGWVFDWGVGVGAVALAVVLVAPAVRVRRAALAVQVLGECAALLMILSHA